ncbi:hypothetical protein MVES_002590 [Malassezia vespertilionis]|uniref:Uncharacterized protein n=1 Tax=Malassezia vespertilionis TaxID=2020962 RepID=A0A2N1JAS0_9BASI|nr:hypothetical protein MVES_002590 [Malassezia vespertilionis]
MHSDTYVGPLKRRNSAAPLSNDDSYSAPQPMHLSLRDIEPISVDDLDDLGTDALPSPSTLTDIILNLHASLYGAKRSVEEIREMVRRYYDGDAVFDSPLVSVHGRNRILDQFILTFAFPGLDVRSELRDVICSDFEFDGTRAGIIDHTVTVSLFPFFFGRRTDAEKRYRHGPHMATGSVTPHPFANYATPSTAEGTFSRSRSFLSSPSGSATPFSGGRKNSFSAGGWSSRTRTPVVPESFTPRQGSDSGYELTPVASAGDFSGRFAPLGAGLPHYASHGLGRRTIWALLLHKLDPLQALRSFFSFELQFNEAGRIVRHEDTWSLRELIDDILPFYNIERFFVGLLASWFIRCLYS